MRTTVVACLLLFGCSQPEPPPQRVVIEFKGEPFDSESTPKVDGEELAYVKALDPFFKINSKAGVNDSEFSIVAGEFLEEADTIKERSKADAIAFIRQWTDGVKTPQEFTAKWRAKHPKKD